MTAPDPQLDDADFLLGAAAGTVLIALAIVGGYFALDWLCGLPPVVWRHAAAVGVVLLGCGAIVGGLLGTERAAQRGSRR